MLANTFRQWSLILFLQTLYEQVRADRNLYSKNLIESQDEIVETKRKLKIMSHQIEQLKEEISNKEAGVLFIISAILAEIFNGF